MATVISSPAARVPKMKQRCGGWCRESNLGDLTPASSRSKSVHKQSNATINPLLLRISNIHTSRAWSIFQGRKCLLMGLSCIRLDVN